jgi:hypothetical protein
MSLRCDENGDAANLWHASGVMNGSNAEIGWCIVLGKLGGVWPQCAWIVEVVVVDVRAEFTAELAVKTMT